MRKVLVCLNDLDLLHNIKKELEQYDITVECASDGLEAKTCLENYNFKAIILQDNLPKVDGVTLAGLIRKRNTDVYIYMLSSRTLDYDVLFSLKNGVNDYIFLPTNVANFALKVNNYLNLSGNTMIHIGNIDIDTDARVIYVDGDKKTLTLKEFKLLKYLIDNKGKAVSREEIFKDVWEYEDYVLDDRTIDTHIKMLRNELGPYKDYIETYRGYGYKFEVK